MQKKSKDFVGGFKIRTPYLGVNNPSISVFKSFFIKSSYTQKNPKKIKKSEKIINSEKNLKNRKNLTKFNKPKDFLRI